MSRGGPLGREGAAGSSWNSWLDPKRWRGGALGIGPVADSQIWAGGLPSAVSCAPRCKGDLLQGVQPCGPQGPADRRARAPGGLGLRSLAGPYSQDQQLHRPGGGHVGQRSASFTPGLIGGKSCGASPGPSGHCRGSGGGGGAGGGGGGGVWGQALLCCCGCCAGPGPAIDTGRSTTGNSRPLLRCMVTDGHADWDCGACWVVVSCGGLRGGWCRRRRQPVGGSGGAFRRSWWHCVLWTSLGALAEVGEEPAAEHRFRP